MAFQFTPLGAGNEVGRSCHLLRYANLTVMLDCGIHPAHPGLGGLPYFDEVDLEEVNKKTIEIHTHTH
jgi:cleavage and polyadenylation specificity factor subunit 3